ncbi:MULTISPECIES: Eco57I restriction-modification methylase domain-containing protein [unclassified Microcoleus]|uniref:Eco57I restriction-modification methylase domain-containing protein n=1 Tax=unclassified Microcoleus TaxID=2642155 RepID=UPI002FD4D3FD
MTNRSSRALFHSKTLNTALRAFSFPQDMEVRHQKLGRWIAALKTGTLDEVKEVSLHGSFINDIFQDILGYCSVIQGAGKAWEINAEQTISDGGGAADGAIGFFTAAGNPKGKAVSLQGKVIAPIELKGAKNDLDRPASGRTESAVDQGWRYANYTPDCRWIIVSNYRELRLYHTNKTPAYYEQFFLTDLADIAAFKRFYFLLCRRNFLPQNQAQTVSVIDRLLKDSDEAQEEITNKLYQEYKAIRLALVKHFRFSGSQDIPNRDRVLIEKAQKTLDRVLFIAFCEDKGLLPRNTLSNAHDHKDQYNPRLIWENYQSVFRWVDVGNDDPSVPGYNGGLFKFDPVLDAQLTVPNPLCSQLKNLTRFDFDTEVSVDILGHIFEQSVTDLEELNAETTGQEYNQKKGKRKTHGVFYTRAFITQYIVEVSLGGYLQRREKELRDLFLMGEVAEVSVQPPKKTAIKFWKAYRDEVLQKTRVIDPACGSGAFLIAAFDYLMQQYERVDRELNALGCKPKNGNSLEFDRSILSNNLYGVDLLPESAEITKLSLWLKTAEPGKTLTYLDDNIKAGNSIVADSNIADTAFDWQAKFSQIFADGGFDVVLGNPPYVRQELLSPIKPYLQANYESYNGVADLYTYFYELGLKILKPGGVLSYIVTNKWLRSGYGEPLRKFFASQGLLEQIIDFGYAPIFEDADTFPCIVAVRKPNASLCISETESEIEPGKYEPNSSVIVCPVPREELANINLTQYVQQHGYQISRDRFTANAWSLEPPAVDDLMQKIQRVGVPLKDFAGVKPLYGIKTGFNEAFLIDEATKNSLVQADPKSAEIIKPYLRGQDIKRWSPEWANLWVILLKSSSDSVWPWSKANDKAEEVFAQTFPSVYKYMKPMQEKLSKRSDQGRYWWELRSCAYYNVFQEPKIITQDLATYSWFCFVSQEIYPVNTCYLWPTGNFYMLGWLCSPITWWICHHTLQKGINDTLRMFREQVETLPIAPPTDSIRAEVELIVSRLIEIAKTNQETHRDVLHWLEITYLIDKVGQKLEDFSALSFADFVAEIRKRMPKTKSSDPLGVAGLKAVRETYNEYAPAIQSRKAEALRLEHHLSDLVNQAYGLTPEEIDLMWKTAPPRMPIARPI